MILAAAAVGYVLLCIGVFSARHRMIFPLRGDAAGTPAQFRIPDGMAVTIPASDGIGLPAWFLPAVPASAKSGVMIWFHGNGETLAGLAPIFREFRVPGVALLAVEYRGYGGPGVATVADIERDALTVWEWLAARPDIDMSKVIVYGRSIGSGPAIHLAAERPVAGLIVESGFTTMRKLAHYHMPLVPSFLAGNGFQNLDGIARTRCPVLLIHGDRDRVVPFVMGQALAAAAGDRGDFWVLRGADHNDSYGAGGEEYVRRVREFVSRALDR